MPSADRRAWPGSVLVGMAFAAGTSADVLRGAFLLLACSIGLGLPFVVAGLFFGFFMRQGQRLRPWLGTIRIASGLFLVALGILVIPGRLHGLSAFVFRAATALRGCSAADPAGPGVMSGSILAAFAALTLLNGVRRIHASQRVPPIRTIVFVTLVILSVLP